MSDAKRYGVGEVARLTGLSPDVIRVWERRYEAIVPDRSPGGTRRYSAREIDRLQLLKTAVEQGQRIGRVAALCDDEIARLVETDSAEPASDALEATLAALQRLDTIAAEGLIAGQLAALGPVRFGREFAAPLAELIGEGWRERRLCVASEHLGSSLLRTMLGAALKPAAIHAAGPGVLFATLPGEPHELGLLIAAVTALGAGANPIYLGTGLPADEIAQAARMSGARAVALSAVDADVAGLVASLAEVRQALSPDVELWVGGRRAGVLPEQPGVSHVPSLRRLEQQVERLRLARATAR